MNAIVFYSYRVPELREFLQERRVNCSLSKNIELVWLCELAVELNLEIIAKYVVNDYKVMDLKRTVKVIGVYVVILSLTEMKTWQKHISNLQDIHTYAILIFLMTYCTWDNQRLQTYKNDNGFQLFSANHVHISEVLEHDYFYIKASCVPETRQTSDPYCVWVFIHQSGRVLSGGCTSCESI